MTTSDATIPDPDGVPKTGEQEDELARRQDAAAQGESTEGESAEAVADEDALEEEESDDVTLGGVAGQAGLGNG